MGRRTFSGSAAQTTTSAMTNVATSLTVADGSTYPSPTVSAPMVIVVDPEEGSEEQILISARSGNVLTVATNGRNWHLGGSGTGQAHSNGALVRHVLDAATVDEVNDHTFTTSRDDHSQYLNTARHAAVAHSGAMITDLTVATADIADGAVTTAKLDADARADLRVNGTTLVAASGSTASATMVDWPGGTVEVSFTKRRTDTLLLITYWTSFSTVTAAAGYEFALKNMATGVDHEANFTHFINATNHHHFYGGVITPSDTAAGSYTYRFRCRVAVNTSTLDVDGNDFAQLLIQERLVTAL